MVEARYANGTATHPGPGASRRTAQMGPRKTSLIRSPESTCQTIFRQCRNPFAAGQPDPEGRLTPCRQQSTTSESKHWGWGEGTAEWARCISEGGGTVAQAAQPPAMPGPRGFNVKPAPSLLQPRNPSPTTRAAKAELSFRRGRRKAFQ